MKFQRHLTVDNENSGVRLDSFIAAHIPELSRSQAKRLIEEGAILLNGAAPKAARAVAAGDRIVANIPPPVEPQAAPQNISLDIIYEDDDIVVVNKPAGMVVHPAAGHWDGTLVNALLFHCKNLSGIGGELKPGIVHRLDAGTSGAIIAAKNDLAHRSLTAQFKARTVEKIYFALVFGKMKTLSGKFDTPIGRSKGDRKRISSKTRKAREALTEWRVVDNFCNELSLLEVRLRTGRMHQIRVHLTEAGHPLVGDPLYGGRRKTRRISSETAQKIVTEFPRPALHAAKLGITHPRTGQRMNFEAKFPEDFELLLFSLRNVLNVCHCERKRSNPK